MTFYQGEKVITPLGPGSVCYQRMRPPDYVEAEAVSVLLEEKRLKLGYYGTIFKAEDVRKVDLDER